MNTQIFGRWIEEKEPVKKKEEKVGEGKWIIRKRQQVQVVVIGDSPEELKGRGRRWRKSIFELITNLLLKLCHKENSLNSVARIIGKWRTNDIKDKVRSGID